MAKIKSLLIVLLLILIVVTGLVIAAEGNNQRTEIWHSSGLGSADSSENQNIRGVSTFNSFFSYEHVPSLTPITGWDPVDPWEVQQCNLNLITEKKSTGDVSSGNAFFFSENTQITMQAQKRFLSDGGYENNIGWFLQTYNESLDYEITIIFKDGSSKLLKDISQSAGSGSATEDGVSNFYAWDSVLEPVKASLSVEDSSIFIVPFINKTIQ